LRASTWARRRRKALRIATRPQDGAYYAFAREYARLLAADGIALEVLATAGTVENLERLTRGDVSLALVQGGSASRADRANVQSLGSVFLEAVWVFTPRAAPLQRLSELAGRRVAVGPAGSGTQLLARQLLAANGVTESNAAFVHVQSFEPAQLLLNGELDARHQPVIGELDMLTDGEQAGGDGYFIELGPRPQWVQIDLGASRPLYAILAWHYHSQARVYRDVIVQVSDDPAFKTGVTTVFNNDHDNSPKTGLGKDKEYIEIAEARLFDPKGAKGRYVRLYSNGNTTNDLNHYVEVEGR
jgi:hypothetical protein